MRAFDMALTALALRASPTRPPEHEKRLVPAIDDACAADLDRAAIPQARAALVASLWPEARPCTVRSVYEQLPAPALLGAVLPVTWAPQVDARALQTRLAAVFERAAGESEAARQFAA